jgi:hypothetical protein
VEGFIVGQVVEFKNQKTHIVISKGETMCGLKIPKKLKIYTVGDPHKLEWPKGMDRFNICKKCFEVVS